MRRSNIRKVNSNSNTDIAKMDPVRFQLRPTRSSYRSPHKHNSKSNTVLYTLLAFLLALICIFILFRNSPFGKRIKYGIVIDGGSTGTRIHVFKYEVREGIPFFDFGKKSSASMKVNPGLSVYAEEPERAGEAVAKLVKFAQGNVPRELWGKTGIRLMATAGLRLLDVEAQGKILESCRRVLRASGFRFRDDWASVISGSDEGIYAWIVANYALGTLGGDPFQTSGIIELGGASAQVTFVSSENIPPEYSHKVKFGNFTYNLYSHSFLHFGQNVAFDLLRDSIVARSHELATESLRRGKPMDPCTPRGYPLAQSGNMPPSTLVGHNKYLSALQPYGNFSECRSASLILMQKGKEKCAYQSCNIGSTFIPKLQGRFLATENFFHTSKFFDLGPKASLSDLIFAGERFCEEDWSNLKRKYQSLEDDVLLPYCFSSAYIVALLHDSLGIALDDERIQYANEVEDIPLDWALGAFILQSMTELDVDDSSWFATMISEGISKFLVLFGILLLIFLTLYVSRWRRKPQIKTIYDLEKGKYIVTRIGRYS